MCINFRLCCMYFLCHWRKIHTVSRQLTQISKRQHDLCILYASVIFINNICNNNEITNNNKKIKYYEHFTKIMMGGRGSCMPKNQMLGKLRAKYLQWSQQTRELIRAQKMSLEHKKTGVTYSKHMHGTWTLIRSTLPDEMFCLEIEI